MSAAKKNSPERGISPISEEEFLREDVMNEESC